jgi:cell wall-associated NlpC family hydrolase
MLKRSHKKKTYFFFSTVIALTLTVNPFLAQDSYAAPSSKTTTKAKLEQALKDYNAAKTSYENVQKQISATDKKMNETFQQLTKVQNEQELTKKRLDQVLIRLYTSGSNNMGVQLFGSKSFSEFLGRLEGIRLLMENDYQIYQQYKKQTDQIKQNQEKIKIEAADSKVLLTTAEKNMDQLESKYKTLQTTLKNEQAKARKNQQAKDVVKAVEKTIAKTSNTKINDPAKAKDTSWLNKARAMIGTVQYKFGGTTYPYFDCSGWVQYVFREYRGIKLPRTSSAQSQVGTPVSKSNLQPGDLIFLQGTYKGGVSHVGIYLGDGLYISNSNEKNDLRIDSINKTYTKTHYWGAKRVN